MIDPRSRVRARALQLLYSNETRQAGGIDQAFSGLARLTGPHPRLLEGARELTDGVLAHIDELDRIAAGAADNWRIDRVAKIELNILRIAIHELLLDKNSPKVIIDEAIWLAQRFAGERAPGFINGVLDNVARSLGRL